MNFHLKNMASLDCARNVRIKCLVPKIKNCQGLTVYMARQCAVDFGRLPTVIEYIQWGGLKVTSTAKCLARRALNNVRKEMETWTLRIMVTDKDTELLESFDVKVKSETLNTAAKRIKEIIDMQFECED